MQRHSPSALKFVILLGCVSLCADATYEGARSFTGAYLGMLSEDTHPVTGEMWGNFPQTYSMVGIINAAVRLSAPWDSQV